MSEIAARIPAPSVRFSDGETYYTMQGVADLLGLHRVTIWRLVREGKLAGAKVGRQVYIRESEVKALLARGEGALPGVTGQDGAQNPPKEGRKQG